MSVRKEKNQYLVREDKIIDQWSMGTVKDAIEHLQQESKGLINTSLDFEVNGYYHGELTISISGDRLATDKEIETYEKNLEKQRVKRKQEASKKRVAAKIKREQEDLKALERVKKAFPHLFPSSTCKRSSNLL